MVAALQCMLIFTAPTLLVYSGVRDILSSSKPDLKALHAA